MNVSSDFSAATNWEAAVATHQWISQQLASIHTLMNTPAAWPTAAPTAGNIVYRSEVYALTDPEQATDPVFYEIGYHIGATGSTGYYSPGFTVALGFSVTAGVLSGSTRRSTAGQPVSTGPAFTAQVIAHAGGLLILAGSKTSGNHVNAVRVGRLRQAGRSVGALASVNGPSTARGTLALSLNGQRTLTEVSLGSPAITAPLRLANGDALLTPIPVLAATGGGVLEPELTPLEFLTAPSTDWANGANRRVLLGGRLVRLAAPAALANNSTAWGSGATNSAMVALAPMENL